eukprot:9994301-Karenia_brevis.AAC.1
MCQGRSGTFLQLPQKSVRQRGVLSVKKELAVGTMAKVRRHQIESMTSRKSRRPSAEAVDMLVPDEHEGGLML